MACIRTLTNNLAKLGNTIHYFNKCTRKCSLKFCSTSVTDSTSSKPVHIDIAENPNIQDVSNIKDEGDQFRYLLRHSKFINMGDPDGKVVLGTVFHVVEDDLYIDFGWKFYCVCPKPMKNSNTYVRGTKVFLRIKDLELSSRFLGSEKDLTLLEADGTIVGLAYSPIPRQETT